MKRQILATQTYKIWKNYSYLEPCQTSMIEPICENS